MYSLCAREEKVLVLFTNNDSALEVNDKPIGRQEVSAEAEQYWCSLEVEAWEYWCSSEAEAREYWCSMKAEAWEAEKMAGVGPSP